MSLRRIVSMYDGNCSVCGTRYHAGDYIWFGKLQKTKCDVCGPDATKPRVISNSNAVIPGHSPIVSGKEPGYVIDWSDLKQIALSAFDGNYKTKRNANTSILRHCLINPDSFHGFSGGQVERWLKEGYQTNQIQGLGMTAPAREKRRRVFRDEGDELHIDRVFAGEENYMSEQTKQLSIPGVSLDILICFAGSTPANVINEFNTWICKTVYSLEMAGIDAEVTLTDRSRGAINGIPGWSSQSVRVKKEGEIADFVSISPMLSPAAYRGFMFTAQAIHAESRNLDISRGLGMGDISADWNVSYDRAKSKIVVVSRYAGARDFPETKMTEAFKKALADTTHGGN